MAAREIKTTLAIDGEQELKRGLDEAFRAMKILGSELKVNTAEFGKNADSMEGLTQRGAILRKEIEQQQKIVEALARAVSESAEAYGESDKRTDSYRVRLNNATAALTKMENELGANESAIEGFGAETDKAEKKTSKWREALEKVGATLGKGIATAAKTAAVAVGSMAVAAGAAAVKLGQAVIRSFGELEQNLGGADAVFEQYSSQMKAYGEEAYKTMGVTQSQYLATANKMGSLFQGSGLSVQQSMELSSQAMQRAADVASVMGIDTQTALDSIAGAAKGNFTMMDNLGVAMNATTIQAYALSKGLDFTWASATNAQKAEVAMQMFFENTEKYAGNFARESTETISGALGMMKAATGSFVAGLGNADADMTVLTQNMVSSFKSVVDNVTPILNNIIQVMPQVIDTLISNIGGMLPMLIEVTVNMFGQVMSTIVGLLPELTPVAVDAILTIVTALVQNIPMILEAANDIIMGLLNGLQTAMPKIVPAAVQGINMFAQGLIQNIPQILAVGIDILLAVVQGITQSIPSLIPAIVQAIMTIITTIIQKLPEILKAGLDIIVALVKGLIQAIPDIIDAMPKIIQAIIEFVIGALPDIIVAGIEIIIALAGGLIEAIPQLIAALPEIIMAIVNGLMDGLGRVGEVGVNLVKGLWEGIKSTTTWLWEKLKGWIGDALGWLANLLGIKSPSTVMANMIGKPMAQGVAEGLLKNAGLVDKAMGKLVPDTDVVVDVNRRFNNIGNGVAVSGGIMTAKLDDSALNRLADKIVRGFRETDSTIMLNDREFGRAVRKAALA